MTQHEVTRSAGRRQARGQTSVRQARGQGDRHEKGRPGGRGTGTHTRQGGTQQETEGSSSEGMRARDGEMVGRSLSNSTSLHSIVLLVALALSRWHDKMSICKDSMA